MTTTIEQAAKAAIGETWESVTAPGYVLLKKERVEALRKALAHQKQGVDPAARNGWVLREVLFDNGEPVAGQRRHDCESVWWPCSVEHVRIVRANPKDWPRYETRLLYAEPQPASQPLTQEQAWENDEIMEVNADVGLVMGDLMRLVRAIERAHGIGGGAWRA